MTSYFAEIYIRVLTGVIFASVIGFGIFYLPTGRVNAERDDQKKPTPTPKKVKYSEFSHEAKAHKIECSACHKFPSDNWNKVRTGESAFPDITEYPNHQSCLSCHKQQFFKGTPPKICAICHTTPSAGNSSRHPFPNPREIFDKSKKGAKAESDFVVGFPHDRHIEIVSTTGQRSAAFINASFIRSAPRRAGEESCSVCHQTLMPQGASVDEYVTKPPSNLGEAFWLKKGMFKTSPIGHTTCFTCHSEEMGIPPSPQTCSACHQLKPVQPPSDFDSKFADGMKIDTKVMLDSWRRRDSSGKFQHDYFAHTDLDCATCHNVASMNTIDPLTKKINITSCAVCHVTATSADGGVLNSEIDSRRSDPKFQCIKCHIAFGRSDIPISHIKAIEAAGK